MKSGIELNVTLNVKDSSLVFFVNLLASLHFSFLMSFLFLVYNFSIPIFFSPSILCLSLSLLIKHFAFLKDFDCDTGLQVERNNNNNRWKKKKTIFLSDFLDDFFFFYLSVFHFSSALLL